MSDSFGTLAQSPATGRFAALAERIRSVFTKEVNPPALDAPEPAFISPPSPAESIATNAMTLRTDQVPWREFGAEQMPLDIASAGIVQPYQQATLQIREFLTGLPDLEQDAIIDLLISFNYAHGIVQPGGSPNSIERIASDWTVGGVGEFAADRMLDNARDVARTGEWKETDTALTDQPFGVRLVRALEEWERRVLEVDATDLPVAEKALKIEGLGIAPTDRDFVLTDQGGNVYQRGALDVALQVAARDIEQGLEVGRSPLEVQYAHSDDGFRFLAGDLAPQGLDGKPEWSEAFPSMGEARLAAGEFVQRATDPGYRLMREQELDDREVGGHEL